MDWIRGEGVEMFLKVSIDDYFTHLVSRAVSRDRTRKYLNIWYYKVMDIPSLQLIDYFHGPFFLSRFLLPHFFRASSEMHTHWLVFSSSLTHTNWEKKKKKTGSFHSHHLPPPLLWYTLWCYLLKIRSVWYRLFEFRQTTSYWAKPGRTGFHGAFTTPTRAGRKVRPCSL